ncbi:MAG TPA: hypothetical protein PLZ13_14625, partial [Ottowia sp.]|nr:hypothetical protein [Ottowia sp.]
LTGVARRGGGPGWEFQLATEVLQALAGERETQARGLTLPQLAAQLRVDTLQVQPVMGALETMDWVGRLDTHTENEEPRYVLLLQPGQQRLKPLIEQLLLTPDPALDGWWNSPLLDRLTVADLLHSRHRTSTIKSGSSPISAGAGSSPKNSNPPA